MVARASYLSLSGLDACCIDGKTACSVFSDSVGALVCENMAEFNGAVSLGGPMTCSDQAIAAISFFGANSSCDAQVNIDGDIVSKAAFFSTLAPCCSNSNTRCSASDGAQICVNVDKFDGSVSLQQGEMTCSMVATYAAGQFNGSCEEEISMDGISRSKADYFDMLNLSACCQDGQAKCSGLQHRSTTNSAAGSSAPPGSINAAASTAPPGSTNVAASMTPPLSTSFLQTTAPESNSTSVDMDSAAMNTICLVVILTIVGLAA